ncbi:MULTISPECIES: HD-GYP domain-containing protein [unclassified Halorhodospira]|uniref:HD-GYP domain-containing protein n=1 Tax=unclassified Halorhodospira TaxID=2626748 RepID=UPI001EE78EC1|nr:MULTISPECIES: HD domain-containing phosphohydrolase [unclassified Halorhodospira]MCG5541574.1 HD domain-containing protein [Halorhodospira sp. M39old]MCG5544637.1 HD domain-containing protein [Halorhodospira sp. M38]
MGTDANSPCPQAGDIVTDALDTLPLSDQEPHLRLSERFERLRCHINQALPGGAIHRIAVAIYEPDANRLKTYGASGDAPSPLDHYETRLGEAPTLRALAEAPQVRIIDDYREHPSPKPHTVSIRESGLRAGMILPLQHDENFFGFLFLNSRRPGYFSEAVVERLAPYIDLARLLAITSIRTTQTLRGAARTAMAFGRARDDETGGHLARMAEYSRLIALELAAAHGLGDEYIEMVYQFAPVHDVGKIAVPDGILLKPGRLTDEEFAQMREHVSRGVAMVLAMTEELGLSEDRRAAIMRNIVAYHHERLDGSGYPTGARGEQIPLEGRIVAVADVFDALTSERPYKRPWGFAEAAETLRAEAKAGKLCGECVEAFLRRGAEIEAIRQRHGHR